MADLRRHCEEKVRVGRGGIVSAFVLWGGNAVAIAPGRRPSVWGIAKDCELLGDGNG